MHQDGQLHHSGHHIPAIDRLVRELVIAADGTAGLDVLLLLAQDPQVCDTAAGYSARLHRPLADVRHSLELLSEHQIMRSCPGPAGTNDASYWLPMDYRLYAALGRLWDAYSTTPSQRRQVLAILAASAAILD